MKTIFFETTSKEKEVLQGLIKGSDLIFYEEKLDENNLDKAKDAETLSVFVNSEIKKEIIDQLPNLKYIITRSVGFDHIDTNYAKEKGIQVSNVPGYGSRTVAEFAFALMLNLSRKVFNARHQLLEGDNFDISKFQGFNLQGKTLGVVGTGKIGKNVIKIAKGFEMNVIAYDLFKDENFAKENNFQYMELNDLLKSSDIITLHAPYNEGTHHMINKNNIGLIKEGAYLINTARGELVETDALVDALSSGRLAGAGLDVLEEERSLKEGSALFKGDDEKIKDFKTLFENQVLLDMENVIVTPHIAFFSKEAEMEILNITAFNINNFLGGTPQNLV